MATTTNLLITKFVDGQSNPDTTINEALDVLDAATSEITVIDIGADADLNITNTGDRPRQWQYAGFEITDTGGAMTAPRNVVLPVASKKFYVLYNNNGGGYALTLKTSGGTGIAVADTKRATLYCDGTNVVRIGPDT